MFTLELLLGELLFAKPHFPYFLSFAFTPSMWLSILEDFSLETFCRKCFWMFDQIDCVLSSARRDYRLIISLPNFSRGSWILKLVVTVIDGFRIRCRFHI